MALKRGNVAKQSDDEFNPEEVEETMTNDIDNDVPFDADEDDAVAVAESNVTQLPVQAQTRQVANTGPVATGGLTQNMEALGLQGLDFGFGAFPIITLDKGEFTSNDAELGDSFRCMIQSSRQKILYRTVVPEGQTPELVYTYDDKETTKGEKVDEVLSDWNRGGVKYTRKVYLDVVVDMCEGTDLEGQMAVLSVSPQSATRFSGYMAQLLRRKGADWQNAVTEVYRGRKVTNVRFPFYPWAFKLVS